jgi:enoyl-CoA hydratase/carnithine racemase
MRYTVLLLGSRDHMSLHCRVERTGPETIDQRRHDGLSGAGEPAGQPLEDLPQATLELAEQVSRAPPFAARLIKRSLNRSLDAQGFRVALNAHFDTHQLSHRSEEYMEARRRGLDSALKRK